MDRYDNPGHSIHSGSVHGSHSTHSSAPVARRVDGMGHGAVGHGMGPDWNVGSGGGMQRQMSQPDVGMPPGLIPLGRGGMDSRGGGGSSHIDESEKVWYYMDPQGVTQGPCSIQQFKGWLDYLGKAPNYVREYEQFRSVRVWREGMPQAPQMPLMQLLDGKMM